MNATSRAQMTRINGSDMPSLIGKAGRYMCTYIVHDEKEMHSAADSPSVASSSGSPRAEFFPVFPATKAATNQPDDDAWSTPSTTVGGAEHAFPGAFCRIYIFSARVFTASNSVVLQPITKCICYRHSWPSLWTLDLSNVSESR